MAFDQPDSFNIGPFEVRRNPSPQELAEKLNRLREAVEQCRLQPGPGYTVSRTRGGTTLQILARPGGSAAANICPFDVTLTATTSGYKISVAPGTVNGVYATNYIACMIPATTTLTVTTSGSTNVVIDATSDGKQVTAYDLSTVTSVSVVSPTTPLAPTGFKWPIAYITGGQVYRTIGCNSLSAVVRESVRVIKTPATPGDNAYDIYYYWDVQSA